MFAVAGGIIIVIVLLVAFTVGAVIFGVGDDAPLAKAVGCAIMIAVALIV
jgi:hypothetical protein